MTSFRAPDFCRSSGFSSAALGALGDLEQEVRSDTPSQVHCVCLSEWPALPAPWAVLCGVLRPLLRSESGELCPSSAHDLNYGSKGQPRSVFMEHVQPLCCGAGHSVRVHSALLSAPSHNSVLSLLEDCQCNRLSSCNRVGLMTRGRAGGGHQGQVSREQTVTGATELCSTCRLPGGRGAQWKLFWDVAAAHEF